MNWKAAFLAFLILFASAITAVAVSLSLPTLSHLGTFQITGLEHGSPLMGDPIDDPGVPG